MWAPELECSSIPPSKALENCYQRSFGALEIEMRPANILHGAKHQPRSESTMDSRLRMTPQQRIRFAQDLRRANRQPGVPLVLRLGLRRTAHNLVKLNLIEAKRANIGFAKPPPRPSETAT